MIIDDKGVEWTRGIVQSPFCCIQYINASRYLPEDRTTEMVKRSHLGQNIVSFVQGLSSENWSQLKLFCTIEVNALRSVDKVEKLCICYDSKYAFSNVEISSRRQKYVYEFKERIFITSIATYLSVAEVKR